MTSMQYLTITYKLPSTEATNQIKLPKDENFTGALRDVEEYLSEQKATDIVYRNTEGRVED